MVLFSSIIISFIWYGRAGKEIATDIRTCTSQKKNPWTIRVIVLRFAPDRWERNGDLNDPYNPPHVDVNEGRRYWCITISYLLFTQRVAVGRFPCGCVTASADGDLMSATSWKKSAQPVFKQSLENKVFAPGHNSFFKSPNGKEDWILYHANSEPGQGCGKQRSPRAQKFTWNPMVHLISVIL